MIPLHIGTTPVNVPTGWHQVTTTRYLAWAEAALAGGDVLTTTAALLDIDADLLASVDVTSAALLFGPLSFLNEEMPPPCAGSYPASVGGEAYLAVEEARMAVVAAGTAVRADYPDLSPEQISSITELRSLPAVWAYLTQRHTTRRLHGPTCTYNQGLSRSRAYVAGNTAAPALIPTARILLRGLLEFLDRHHQAFEAQDVDSDPMADAAGVDRFFRYGHLNAITALVGNDMTKWAEAYQMSAETVYLAIQKQRDDAAYQRELARLHTAKT